MDVTSIAAELLTCILHVYLKTMVSCVLSVFSFLPEILKQFHRLYCAPLQQLISEFHTFGSSEFSFYEFLFNPSRTPMIFVVTRTPMIIVVASYM